MIHFDFDDRYQDELVVGQAITRRDGLLLAALFHVAIALALTYAPRLAIFQPDPEAEARRQELVRPEREQQPRFVFVEPRIDLETTRPREQADLSDRNRRSQAPQRAVVPENVAPLSRGNSAERREPAESERARGPETPEPPSPAPPVPSSQPEAEIARNIPPAETGLPRPPERPRPAGGALGDALRNLQRYVQNETFHNPQGGADDPGATIQFDSKGVEFGPWLRRFVAQVRRNWFIPQAAWTFRGRVVLQFNIHKSGRISDVAIVQPSDIDAFNRAAYNAILGSSPTEPLPPEYPDQMAFFTVTFYYNEQPPGP